MQAFRADRLLAQKWFIVKEGRISKGQIELSKKTSVVASAEVFPARTKVSFPVLFEEMGAGVDFKLNQNSEEQVDLKSNPELAVFQSQKSQDFAQHTYVTASKLLKKRFKLVSKNWLETFLNQRRSNANRALGMVVGFISEEDFKVVKETTTSLNSSSQIFYFDKDGQFVDQGFAGGGFIITDVNPGVQTTVVSMRGKETFLNRLMVVKPYSVSIF